MLASYGPRSSCTAKISELMAERKRVQVTTKAKDLPVLTLVPNRWTSENGVVLKLEKVSRFVIVEMGRKIPMPKVPLVFNPDKDREEENPQDPDYLAAVQESSYERAMMTIMASLSLGTKLLSLPEGMAGPEDDEWLEVVESLGIEVPKDNARLRYASWLKYIALDDASFNELITLVIKFSGLATEQDVSQAQEAFRSNAEWALDPTPNGATEDQSTHNDT